MDRCEELSTRLMGVSHGLTDLEAKLRDEAGGAEYSKERILSELARLRADLESARLAIAARDCPAPSSENSKALASQANIAQVALRRKAAEFLTLPAASRYGEGYMKRSADKDVWDLPVYPRASAPTPTAFVEFWARNWTSKDKEQDSRYYDPAIGRPFTCVRLLKLFRWKNQTKLSRRKLRRVLSFVASIPKLEGLSNQTDAQAFLEEFPEGGAIWRIFLLHCWSCYYGSRKYPIYDQHVHRAMMFICKNEIEETGNWTDPAKIQAYLDKYIPFFDGFSEHDPQKVDQALMIFGRFIKTYPALVGGNA